MTTQAQTQEVLSAFDIGAINAARASLEAFANRVTPKDIDLEGWQRDHWLRSFGHAQGVAEEAAQMLFSLLNYATHHLGLEISDDDLIRAGARRAGNGA